MRNSDWSSECALPIYPVVSVVRDEKGVLTSISPSGRDSTQHESIIYFETDRADARRRRRLIDNVRSTLAEVRAAVADRSEEHTSELQSLMRISYAVFCLKKKNTTLSCTQSKTSHH